MMKTAKAPQPDGGPASSSRRAQPVRQTRTNPPRSSGLGGAANGRDSGHEQPIDIFPAITHFTDAVSSLPKDLVRHFTLLKEVDAKIFAPEESLFQLVDAALNSNPPEPRPAANDTSRSSAAPASASTSAQNSTHGNPLLSTQADYHRRHLHRQTAFRIQEMLVSLEEKNHVITTANEALSKQLARIDDVWPHVQAEFSDEAKWGSTTHWAYPENRVSRASAAERSRRDGASAITAAAQQLAEEAAARTDARKQALAAKKGLKNHQHQDSDHDADHENNKQHKNESSKKQNNGSKRKTAEASTPVGLGITTSAPVNGNPPPKKRKVENNKDKTTNGAQPMERALSGVLGNNASKAKTSSPRSTPAPEAGTSKKRKALPTVNGQSKKSKNGPAAVLSPQIVSSPIIPNFAESKNISRNSPVPAPPATSTRPASSRARQNSIASSADNAKNRPSSSASNKLNGTVPPTQDAVPVQNGSRPTNDAKAAKEIPVPVKTEVAKEPTPQPNPAAITAPSGSRKNSVAKEDTESKGDLLPLAPQTVTTVVTTKSGRASKPSTPALGSFPEAVRSRSSRTAQTGAAKRSHKKGAAAALAAAQVAAAADDDANSSAQGDDDGDIDANEPRYCYCNGVSYGEMVACDADDCEKEWFHLGCVGLKSAPSSSTKWYCDNCKNRMKNGKKVNGRGKY